MSVNSCELDPRIATNFKFGTCHIFLICEFCKFQFEKLQQNHGQQCQKSQFLDKLELNITPSSRNIGIKEYKQEKSKFNDTKQEKK